MSLSQLVSVLALVVLLLGLILLFLPGKTLNIGHPLGLFQNQTALDQGRS